MASEADEIVSNSDDTDEVNNKNSKEDTKNAATTNQTYSSSSTTKEDEDNGGESDAASNQPFSTVVKETKKDDFEQQDEINDVIDAIVAAAGSPSITTEPVVLEAKRKIRDKFSAEALMEAANQNLNGELSLLQTYEKRGVMNEVFGSQSVLSQELMHANEGFGHSATATATGIVASNTTTQHRNMSSSIFDKGMGRQSKEEKTIVTNSTLDENEPTTTQSSCGGGGNPPSSISTYKDLSNGTSQFSFIVGSLPNLSFSENQVTSDTQPTLTLSQSQASTSAYDVIIEAAQAHCGQDKGSGSGIMMKGTTSDLNEKVLSASLSSSSLDQKRNLQQQQNQHPNNPLKHEAFDDDNLFKSQQHHQQQQQHHQEQQQQRKRPRLETTMNENMSVRLPRIPLPNSASIITRGSVGFIQTNGTTYSVRRTREQKQRIEEETKYIANRAAELVRHMRVNRRVEKKLLLNMALTRENPRSTRSTYPAVGTVIHNGFYWAQFPPLEQVLRDKMEIYYELSIEKCQSRDQQAFNNELVTLVNQCARENGWTFDPGVFDEKKIRDRIRCFFKTHIQNAKKRLKTMVRNPSKKANAKALAAHLTLIEKCDLIDKVDDNTLATSGIFETISDSNVATKNGDRQTYDSDAHDAAQDLVS